MSTPQSPPPSPDADTAPLSSLGLPLLQPNRRLHWQSLVLMALTLVLALGGFFYLLYARGAFEDKQSLILTADNSDGISIGMDLTFSGFPIGSVQQIQLADDGTVRIHIAIPESNAHRLRESSLFTLVRNILGATSLRAYTSDWDDPPLPDNAERTVLYGDASAEIPQLLASTRVVLDNLGQLTSGQSDLAQSLAHLNQLGATLGQTTARDGLLRTLLGNGEEAEQVRQTLTGINHLVGRLNRMAGHADEQVFGAGGLVRDAQASTQELQALLSDTRQSLEKINRVLDDAKTISGNLSETSTDLNVLRMEVQSSLRKVDGLLGQINSRWPFGQTPEITLP